MAPLLDVRYSRQWLAAPLLDLPYRKQWLVAPLLRSTVQQVVVSGPPVEMYGTKDIESNTCNIRYSRK